MKVITYIFLSIVSIFSSSTLVHANKEYVADVSSIQKKVTIISNKGQAQPAQLYTKLYIGDELRTGRNASIKITFRDGSFVKLLGSSAFKIDDYVYDPIQKNGKATFSIQQATLSFSLGKLAELAPHKLHLNTSVATLGLTGSSAVVKCTTDRLWVTGNKLWVEDVGGNRATVDPGFVFLVTEDGIFKRAGMENLFVEGALNVASRQKTAMEPQYNMDKIEKQKKLGSSNQDDSKSFRVSMPSTPGIN
tara:strand:- start:2076 stop:2819 length:744 start_codon:yes stop_codon:yes gene_type:complete